MALSGVDVVGYRWEPGEHDDGSLPELWAWPSVIEYWLDTTWAAGPGDHLLLDKVVYRIETATGPDRPPHCPAPHPVDPVGVVCAFVPDHRELPHVACSRDYIEERAFTITRVTRVG